MSKRKRGDGGELAYQSDNVTVGVLEAVEDVLGSEEWIKGEAREREKSLLEISVDDAMAVRAADSTENRANDSDRVVLRKLALCEDTVKELSAGGELERKVIFCARLKALVELDLGWV